MSIRKIEGATRHSRIDNEQSQRGWRREKQVRLQVERDGQEIREELISARLESQVQCSRPGVQREKEVKDVLVGNVEGGMML
jgi:hypothetical protein